MHSARAWAPRAWKCICMLLFAAVLAFSPNPLGQTRAFADTDETPAPAAQQTDFTTVKVGYFDNGDYMYKNDDGSYGGYDVEYLYTIAGYADWNIQFVDFASVKDSLAALQTGQIDLETSIAKTSERENLFLFSNQTMGQTHISIMTRLDDDRFSAGDSEGLSDVTTAVLKGSVVKTQYTDWCAQNGLTSHIAEFDNTTDRDAALMNGSVDAIAAGSTIEGTQVIAQFPAIDLYSVFNQDKATLKVQFDRATTHLGFDRPTFTSDLRLKYFPLSKNSNPVFSNTEKAYIANHPTAKVAVMKKDAPFSTWKPDGSITGILSDYYRHLSEVTGIQFNLVAYDTKDDEYKALADDDVSLIGATQYDVYSATDHNVLLSNTYLQANIVQLVRVGTETITSAAVPQCTISAMNQIQEEKNTDLQVVDFTTGDECFAALKSHQVDSVVCSEVTATWLLNRNRSSDYAILSFGGDVTWTACSAVAPGKDGNTLRSILNKSFAVDNGYINQLVASDTLQDSADLATVFDRIPVFWIGLAACVFLAVLLVLVFALISIHRKRKQEHALAQQQAAADKREAELAVEERTNAMKSDFFSTVSHDMRTPLNGIVGFTDLALQSNDGAQMQDYLSKIRTSSLILQDLVSDTLVMSRIENGKQSLNLAPINTLDLLEGICLPIQAAADDGNVKFVVDATDMEHADILVDRVKIQKVFLNLLSNAVKFAPPGSTVRFTVRTNRTADNAIETHSIVEDEGPGISDEFLPHIFEPFAQEKPEDAGTSGTGLGLAIAKRLLDAMDGTIDVQSRKGQGATFAVVLPFKIADGAQLAEREHISLAERKDICIGKKILVCEDNTLNMEIIRTMLERLEAQTVPAENGKAGVEAFKASKPNEFDAVLLDLRMPVMDGITAAKTIRALDRPDAQAVPILAISADCYPEDIRKCTEAGMNGHLSKPIQQEDLARTLSSLFALTKTF